MSDEMSGEMSDELSQTDKETLAVLAACGGHGPYGPYVWRSMAPASAALMRTLLARKDLDSWLHTIVVAYGSLSPDDQQTAYYDFREWFIKGIHAHLPPTHVAVLELAWEKALDDVDAGAAHRAAALVKTMHEAGDSKDHRGLLGRALLLLARRLGEDGDLVAAEGTAQRAQEVFAQLGDAEARAFAMRVRAAAFLFLKKNDEALALLDEAHAAVGLRPCGFARSGTFRRIQGTEGDVALWTNGNGDDWVHALLATSDNARKARAAAEAQEHDEEDFERGPFV